MRKPFLRIGNSEHLPVPINPYIKSVIISDKLTGDFFIESSSKNQTGSTVIDYVGPRELVEGITNFVGNKNISAHPITPQGTKDYSKGTKVVFYEDGNCKIFLDGNCLFNLYDREKSDHHHIEIIQRIEDFVNKAEGSLTPAELSRPGFVLSDDNTFAFFNKGIIQLANITVSSIISMANAMIPPSMIRHFGGPANQTALLNQVKWIKTSSPNDSIGFLLDPAEKGKNKKFVDFLKHIGTEIEILNQQNLPQHLNLATYKPFLSLTPQPSHISIKGLPGSSGLPPLLLPSIPYFTVSALKDGRDVQASLEQFMGSEGREFIKTLSTDSSADQKKQLNLLDETFDDAIGLSILFWLWNHIHLQPAKKDQKDLTDFITQRVLVLQNSVGLPVRAELLQSDRTVLFFMKEGTTLQTFRSWEEERQNIANLARFEPDESFFESERARLIETLQILLRGENIYAPPAETTPPSTATPDTTTPDSTTPGTTTPDTIATTHTATTSKAASVKQKQAPGSKLGSKPGSGIRQLGKKKVGKKILIPVAALASLGLLTLLLILLLPRGTSSSSTEITSADTTINQDINNNQEQTTQEQATQNQEQTAQEEAAQNQEETAQEEAAQNQEKAASVDNNATEFKKPEWSVIDILFITNWISYNNGYDFVGESTILERNPDWIFPGNSFTLPDESSHEVLDGETIWFIAGSFLDRAFEKSNLNEEEFYAKLQNMDYNQTVTF